MPSTWEVTIVEETRKLIVVEADSEDEAYRLAMDGEGEELDSEVTNAWPERCEEV